MRLALVSCLAWCLAGCAAAARTHVVVVSIDGLKPESYLEPDRLGLAVPTFRRMVREGVVGTDTRTVLPSVTYPSHTTIATGVPPAAHGIVSNYAFDPLGRNMDGWWWYAEDIRAPTVWDAARAAGRTVALIDWPVTVGAKADVLVPEYWRAGTADDQKIIRALATPGFLDEVAARRPGFWDRYTPPNVTDEAGVDLAEHALETRRPDLLFLHIWQTDDRQHDSAPGSAPALAAIENADRQLARLIAAAGRAGIAAHTVFVVVSDHGFAAADRSFRPGVLLRERGLLTLDDRNKVVAWRAQVDVEGFTYVYLRDPNDAEAARAARAAFEGATGPDQPIARIFDAAEIRARGGDPKAIFGLDPAPGWRFLPGAAGPVTVLEPRTLGVHGMDPERPEMRASLLFWGEGIAAGRRLDGASLVDVAGTVADLLGIPFPSAQGRRLRVRP
ncbi:MAG TPA: ectonucleotide pyrophosphatase/phosphodiesterase [Haliangiales bacterium]|nr:ectonucleotide pyrophosphatase/phosphodiesterase [Haliangiales bacterium]